LELRTINKKVSEEGGEKRRGEERREEREVG